MSSYTELNLPILKIQVFAKFCIIYVIMFEITMLQMLQMLP